MKMNMDQWTQELLEAPVKKAIPVLSFPSIQLLGISVKDLISDSTLQANGMKAVADRTPKAGGSVRITSPASSTSIARLPQVPAFIRKPD